MLLQMIHHPQNDICFCDMFMTPTKCHIDHSSLQIESDSGMPTPGLLSGGLNDVYKVYKYKAVIHCSGDKKLMYIRNGCRYKHEMTYVGFQVLTAVVMKSSIFWDIMPYSPLKVNRRFRGTRRLHLQGRRNQREAGSKQSSSVLKWRQHVPLKRRLNINGLHGVLSQTIEPLIKRSENSMETQNVM
jgi:hypothetical protein